VTLLFLALPVRAQPADPSRHSGSAGGEPTFEETLAESYVVKAARTRAHREMLKSRYDLVVRTDTGQTMSAGKPIPVGPAARPQSPDWQEISRLTPEEIKQNGWFPYKPLPFPDPAGGGAIFPEMTLRLMPRLTRFDVEFDLPETVLPDEIPAIYLTTRPDLGDVAKGRLITVHNYYEIFNSILNAKQLEGLRLLLTQFPQQQFNATQDRRTERHEGMLGVACFDCHVNGHTNGATRLVGDIRPQEFRHRLDTTSLRGVNVQRLFGSQRALKTVEDFAEFEQSGAYFDGDIGKAALKGGNVLAQGSQAHFMGEFMAILDFPPAPRLDIYGELDPSLSTKSEIRGQDLFNGKGRCSSCHPAPYYTDNTMHNLRAERFYLQDMVNGMMMAHDGPIKTFTLRGIRDSPPYLHDGRCLTLEDTVEYFNLIQQLRLSEHDKQDLVAFLRCL
jgi:cytochrome c peroxidase